jgi:hypothetical protein
MSRRKSSRDERESEVAVIIAPPVIHVTLFEKISSGLWTLILAATAAVVIFFSLWYMNKPPQAAVFVPVEMIEIAGGDPQGAENETLKLETPEVEVKDPAVDPVEQQDPQMTETSQDIVELANEVAQQLPEQLDAATSNTGEAGSANGTGRRPLGSGQGNGSLSRERRWFIQYGDNISVEEYAKQLDYFKVELGALLPSGKLVYLSQLSTDKPVLREVNSGANEKRLYMTWSGGDRKKADEELLRKAGINERPTMIFHFYQPAIESTLAQLELASTNRPLKDIRRTYFTVFVEGKGYRFTVVRQTYF